MKLIRFALFALLLGGSTLGLASPVPAAPEAEEGAAIPGEWNSA